MFAYKVDRVVLFYHHHSPIYNLMHSMLLEEGIAFEMRHYSELAINMDYIAQLRDNNDQNYTLVLFDDATNLVESNKAFNHLIHVARHSGIIFILSIHGIVFTRASARAMVSKLILFLQKL